MKYFGALYRPRGNTGLQCRCNGKLGSRAVPRIVHTARRCRLFHVQQTLGVAGHLARNRTHGIIP